MTDLYLIDFPLRGMRNQAVSISHSTHFAYVSPGQRRLYYLCHWKPFCSGLYHTGDLEEWHKRASVIDIHTYFVQIKGKKLLQRWTPMLTREAAATLESIVFR